MMRSHEALPEEVENLVDAGTELSLFRVRPDASVAEAFEQLRQNGRGVAAVVDGDDTMVGTLSDSDIRRAVLNGTSVGTAVAELMSQRLVVVNPAMPDEEIVELLRVHRLRSVPVVEGGQLVGMRFLDGLPAEHSPRTAVIMAGGRGTRLRPVTDKVPKPLLKVGSRSIVERLILGMAAAGVEEIFLAVNYMAEAFTDRLGSGDHLGVTLRYLREEHAMGTAGALSLLPPDIEGPLLVANGDILTTVDFSRLFEFHWRHLGAITVAGVEYRSPIPYGVLRSVEHHLLSIDEKPERRDFCSAGIYVLEPDVLRLLTPKEAMGMPELIAEVLAEGLPVHVFPILEGWYDIGETAQFERVLVQFATGAED
jgi:dTDP-glucose pyrophosphorylase/CBS domain-containing protein